jgi:hypothetical protein
METTGKARARNGYGGRLRVLAGRIPVKNGLGGGAGGKGGGWSGGVVEWWSGGVVEWWSGGVVEWWTLVSGILETGTHAVPAARCTPVYKLSAGVRSRMLVVTVWRQGSMRTASSPGACFMTSP